MTAWDKALIALVLAAAVAGGFLVRTAVGASGPANAVIVKVDGAVRERLPLDQDRVMEIRSGRGSCRLEIKDGAARVIEADCRDHLCESQGPVDAKGGLIVCLPNEILVTGTGGEKSPEAIDAVVR